MRIRFVFSLALLLVASTAIRADTHYVSTNGLHQTPFTNGWASAATNILAAYNAITAGDTILLSNGIHRVTAQIDVLKGVTITGAYGAAQTIIDGGGGAYSGFAGWGVRTITFSDITYTNFAGSFNAAVGTYYLNRCVIAGNTSAQGGIYANAGVAVYATNCVIKGSAKSAGSGGNGVYFAGGGTCVFDDCEFSENNGAGIDAHIAGSVLVLRNSRIRGNTGTGVWAPLAGSSVENCLIVSNRSGVIMGAGSTIQNCRILYNQSGVGVNLGGGVMRNCLVAYNTGGSWEPAGVKGPGTINNCTVVSNGSSAIASSYGGLYSGSAVSMTSINSVVYFNVSDSSRSNYYSTASDVIYWTNSCTAPKPGDSVSTNCIDVNPQFVDRPAGDFHLARGSRCINAGLNQDWMTNAVDLDGRPRVRGGTVDIGAYEWFPQGVVFSFR